MYIIYTGQNLFPRNIALDFKHKINLLTLVKKFLYYFFYKQCSLQDIDVLINTTSYNLKFDLFVSKLNLVVLVRSW